MKQIEEGCLAIVVNSDAGNDGVCVTVGKYLGSVVGWEGRDQWEVDIELKAIYTIGGGVKPGCCHAPEVNLLRIDSYDGELEEETAQEEVTA